MKNRQSWNLWKQIQPVLPPNINIRQGWVICFISARLRIAVVTKHVTANSCFGEGTNHLQQTLFRRRHILLKVDLWGKNSDLQLNYGPKWGRIFTLYTFSFASCQNPKVWIPQIVFNQKKKSENISSGLNSIFSWLGNILWNHIQYFQLPWKMFHQYYGH